MGGRNVSAFAKFTILLLLFLISFNLNAKWAWRLLFRPELRPRPIDEWENQNRTYFMMCPEVIWDGGTIHRSQDVKQFLAAGGAPQIHLERFPAYAPELNPDECVWHHLKDVELRNLCCNDLVHLNQELDLAFRRIRRDSVVAPRGVPSFGSRAS